MRLKNPSVEGATLDAIEVVYRSRLRAFLRVAAGVAGERHAEDAVHLGFVRALNHRHSFRGDSSLETWIWRTVINAAHDLRRRDERAMLVDSVADNVRTNGGRPHEAHGSPIREAVMLLAPRQRLVLFLRYHADLDYDGIAQIAGITPGTVAATLHRAHAALRLSLEEESKCAS